MEPLPQWREYCRLMWPARPLTPSPKRSSRIPTGYELDTTSEHPTLQDTGQTGQSTATIVFHTTLMQAHVHIVKRSAKLVVFVPFHLPMSEGMQVYGCCLSFLQCVWCAACCSTGDLAFASSHGRMATAYLLPSKLLSIAQGMSESQLLTDEHVVDAGH